MVSSLFHRLAAVIAVLASISPTSASTSTSAIPAEEKGDHLYSRRSLTKRQENNDNNNSNFNISFYHINDVHAHLDEFSSSGTDCVNATRGCYGGYARVKTVLDRDRPTHQNSLFVNAGDEFQGTLFYSYYKGEKIAETLNQLGFDAMTLGNHEFDGGDEELADFLANLTFPVTSANIKSTNPVLNRTILPYVEFPEYNLAVIGVTTETTPSIANVGNGTTFSNATVAVQDTIDLIKATTNITRLAALTHIGYEEDQKLAQQTTGLYLIMGGHSHTPLGNMSNAQGPYPTIVENADGEEVFVVTAYRWGEYLGYIDVVYDSSGRITEYHGAPIHLTNTTEQDPELQAQIEEWRGPFEAFAAEVVGETLVELDASQCRTQECLLGDFMADAMLNYRTNSSSSPSSTSSNASFALINAGGIRATIDMGPITRGEILTSFPFGNAIVELPFTGTEINQILEGILSGTNLINNRRITSFLQVSKNIKIEYNPSNSNGTKLVSVTINDEPIQDSTTYTMVTLDFLAGGGDNFWEPRMEFAPLDLQDQVLTDYVISQSPVDVRLEGRIRAVNGTAGNNGSTGTGGGNNETTTAPPPNSASRFGQSSLGGGMLSTGIFAVVFGIFFSL